MEVATVKPIQIGSSRSRIRLSPQIISKLGWKDYTDGFTCYALLRKPGEILCSPSDMVSASGEHPFQVALDVIDSLQPIADPCLINIPPTHLLLASQRLSKFEARWASPAKKQIDLKLGADLIQYLLSENKRRVFPICWGRILILISEDTFLDALQTDFTNGEMQLS